MDEFGEEAIIVENDGTTLSIVIRGVRFEGYAPDSLEPQPLEADETHSFTLHHGCLIKCILEFEMPLTIEVHNETLIAELYVRVRLGTPQLNGGIDQEILLTLVYAGTTISSIGTTSWFLDELSALQTTMPEGHLIKSCVHCSFSEYSPYGFGQFGCLACFRDNKPGIVAVQNKNDLFCVWHSMTEYVQETHLCPEFQSKI